MTVLHKVLHYYMEDRGIRKMYGTTLEDNASLRVFPKAVCVYTHTEHTQSEKLCALHMPKISVLTEIF